MSVMLHLSAGNQSDFINEIEAGVKELGLNPTRPVRIRNGTLPVEIIVALGSAGAFTAIIQFISNLLLKNKDRELTISIPSTGKTLTLKGHSLPEEKELIKLLVPVFAEQPKETPTPETKKSVKPKRYTKREM